MMRSRQVWLAIVVVSSLSACSQLQPPVPHQTQQQFVLPNQFSLAGRIGVKLENKGHYGNFDWQHHSGNDQLDILSPLGQTIARLSADQSGVRLQQGERIYEATSAEALTQHTLGWGLPLDNLRFWIHGQPAPNTDYQATASGFRQQGWLIESEPQGSTHPQRVILQRPQLDIRFAIHRWN